MDQKLLNKVFKKIDGYKGAMIALQKDLTAIPALSPVNDGDGEAKKAAFLKKWIKNEGLFEKIDQFDSPDKRVPSGIRPNLVAVMKGASPARTVWIMSHLDIVPPGDLKLWKSDPYKLKVAGGKIFGRGVEDNQHAIITSLFAVKAFRDLGVKPPSGVGAVIVSDEETGSEHGIQYLLKKHNIFKKTDFIIVPDAGVPDGSMIEVAEKSIYWLRIETKGKQCHASTPEQGRNAHKAAAHLITRLGELYRIYSKKDPVFDPPISTFEPTKKEANVPNINTIPADDVFYMDMRVIPGYKLADVDRTIAKIVKGVEKEFGVTIKTSPAQREEAAPATPGNAPVVKALSAAIKDVYGVKAYPKGIGGGTVAAFFRRAGVNAVVWSKIDEVAHQPNEYTYVANMIGDTKVFAHVCLQE